MDGVQVQRSAKEMPAGSFKRITLTDLKRRSGLKLRHGNHVEHRRYPGKSIHKHATEVQGQFHDEMEKLAIAHFVKRGYRIFPFHIGIAGHSVWPDFAVARSRKVILVECVTDWGQPVVTICNKQSLAAVAEVWFVTEDKGAQYLRGNNYSASRLRGDKWDFWLCRPPEKSRTSRKSQRR